MLTTTPIYAINTSEDVGAVSGYFMQSGMYYGSSGYYEWVDYCPNCHHYNCLADNPKGTYEGEVTCMRCSADYDGTNGIDKWGGSYIRAQLTPYVKEEPEVEPEPQNQTVVVVPEKSKLELMRDIYNSNKLM